MNQDVGFSSEREGLIHTNVPKALAQVLELDLQVYVIFVLAERATGMLFKEKPIYQIGEGCSGGNTDHQDSSLSEPNHLRYSHAVAGKHRGNGPGPPWDQ